MILIAYWLPIVYWLPIANDIDCLLIGPGGGAVPQLTACAELQHKVYVLGIFEGLVQLDDVGMVHP